MAITKSTLVTTLTKAKTCMDVIYCKKSELGYNVIVSDTEPTTGAHWIKPEDTSGTVTASKLVVSTSQPSDSYAVWIQPEE